MDPQEKLEAMFCPRLDSALVASIYHDMRDFKACIPILSALAAAATPSTTDTPTSTSINGNEASTGHNSPTVHNNNNNASRIADNNVNNVNKKSASAPMSTKNTKSSALTTTTTSRTGNGSTSSNDKNILIWSEEVANSNASTSTLPHRSSGLYKQGQVITPSSYQQPTSSTTAASPSTPAEAAGSSSAAKPSFKAQRNPKYMQKLTLIQEPEPEQPEQQHVLPIPSKEPQDEDTVDEAGDPLSRQQNETKAKKNRRQKRTAKAETMDTLSAAGVPLSGKTWRKEPSSDKHISDQLSALSVSDSQSISNERGQYENDVFEEEEEEVDEGFMGIPQELQSITSTTSSKDRHPVKAEELEFLKSCFPDHEHSDEYLSQVLWDSRRDLEAAVEMILSQMFLDNEQVETSSSGSGSFCSSGSQATTSSSATTSSRDDTFFQGVQKSKKKIKGAGGGGVDGISAWGASRHQHSAWPGHNDALVKTIDRQDEFLIPESNEWATFDHQISMLMNVFHTVPQKTIVSEYHANGAHLFKTVESLEKRIRQEDGARSGVAEGRRERQSEFDVSLAQLMEMFPDHSAVGLKRMLVYNGGNFQDAMNAVLAADIAGADQRGGHAPSSPSTSKRANTIPLQADIRFSDKNYIPTPTASGNRLKSLPSTSNPFPGGPRPFPNTILDSSNAELYNDEDDPIWCRQRAHELLEQRNELFRKAAKSYQLTKGKGVGMGGIAAYYADEGKKLDIQGKQWHMRAARAVVQQHRVENNDPNLVDLHGLTIAEAQTVVKEAVTQWFARATMQASRIAAKPLKIICGVGSHSKDRVARLYPTVLSLLMKDGWRCEAENGVILVKGVSRLTPTSSTKPRR